MGKKSRQTVQKEILRRFIDKTTTVFSAQDACDAARSVDESIGRATVYRFLSDCVAAHVLHTYTCDRRTVYSKKPTGHCHFICEKTGEVTHFTVDSIDFLKNKIPGKICSFQLEVRGICDRCRSR